MMLEGLLQSTKHLNGYSHQENCDGCLAVAERNNEGGRT